MYLSSEKTKVEQDWKLNLTGKDRKSATMKTMRERVPPVGASAEASIDESTARGTSRTSMCDAFLLSFHYYTPPFDYRSQSLDGSLN